MSTSKLSIHLKEKSSLVSSTRRPTKTAVPSSPERDPAPPPQRKTVIRSTSTDAAKSAKSFPQQPPSSAPVANAATKSRLPAAPATRKPPEKPPSPSRQPLQKTPASTTTNALKERTLKIPAATIPRAAVSPKPAATPDKAARTLKTGATQPLVRVRTPAIGSAIYRRKETTSSAHEEPVVTAGQARKEAHIHVEDNEPANLTSTEGHVSDHEPHVEEHEPVNISSMEDHVHDEPSDVVEQKAMEIAENCDSEQPDQHEPSSSKQEPEPKSPLNEDGNGNHDGNQVHDSANEEILQGSQEKPVAEIIEEPKGGPSKTEKIEADAEENKAPAAESTTTAVVPEKIEVDAAETNASAAERSTTVTMPEKVEADAVTNEAPAAEPSTNAVMQKKIEADAEANKAPVTEPSTASVVPEKGIVHEKKGQGLGPVASFKKPTVQLQAKKKEAQMNNEVIEETRGKLLEKKKSKVGALVGAFETVMSLQETEV